MHFEFATATRIVFGAGTVREAGRLAKEFGRCALVVTGRDPHRAEPLLKTLREHELPFTIFSVPAEPEVRTVAAGVEAARRGGCDVVMAIGGGSAIDAAKAIAAMLTNSGELLDYLEVIGRGKALTQASAPCIAIPTTAGTGSEVTRNAVLGSPEHRVKVSLRSPLLLPRAAVVDPELTHDLPPSLTASTGLDALTQLIEPYVCSRANPMTDGPCREGLVRVGRSLRRAWENGRDVAAREDMALAGLFGGLALANAGLGAVHGFAGPVGGMFPAPHGRVCAALLPHVMETNLRALRQRRPGSEAVRRFGEIARLLTGESNATAESGIQWICTLVGALGIPGLSSYGITRGDIGELVTKAAKASSMKANPIELTTEELTEIVERALP